VEEVGRIWGFDKLPITLPSRRGVSGRLEPLQRLRRRAEDAIAACGLYEILGWSFSAPGLPERLGIPPEDPRSHAVRILNPMSEEQSFLRTTLLGSLLDNVRRNRSRGLEDVRLWERGAIYLAGPDGQDGRRFTIGRPAAAGTLRRPDVIPGLDRLPAESDHLGALLAGRLRPPTWREPEPPRADFFVAKGVLGAVLDTLRVPWRVEAAREPFLHPGRSARVLVGEPGEPVGWLGELHPAIASAWDIDGAVAGFEIDLPAVLAAAPLAPDFEDVTSFPSVRQDLAVDLPDHVPAADVIAVVRTAGGALLRHAEVFDVYAGSQVGEGRRSLALRLEFRADDRTLTDEEVAQRRARIVGALAERLGGRLRG
jgi:phenylalanyl-tRNA synthetase beta chain